LSLSRFRWNFANKIYSYNYTFQLKFIPELQYVHYKLYDFCWRNHIIKANWNRLRPRLYTFNSLQLVDFNIYSCLNVCVFYLHIHIILSGKKVISIFTVIFTFCEWKWNNVLLAKDENMLIVLEEIKVCFSAFMKEAFYYCNTAV
jgi:hypothetical protein